MSGPRQRNGYHGTGLTAEAHAVLRAEAFATGQTMSEIASRIIIEWLATRAQEKGVRLRAAQRIERKLKRETLAAGWDDNPQGDVALELARRQDEAP